MHLDHVLQRGPSLIELFLPRRATTKNYIEEAKHRKNCETALFKVWIVEKVFFVGSKEGQVGRSNRKVR